MWPPLLAWEVVDEWTPAVSSFLEHVRGKTFNPKFVSKSSNPERYEFFYFEFSPPDYEFTSKVYTYFP